MRGGQFQTTLLIALTLGAAPAFGDVQCDGPEPVPSASEFAANNSTQVRIVDWAWTSAVGGHCPNQRRDVSGGLEEPILLWMRVEGSRAAWEQMRDRQRLPLIHVWEWAPFGMEFSPAGGQDVSDEFSASESIPLHETRPEVIDALEREINGRDFFDFRTWSQKDNVLSGRFQVRVVDQLGDELRCATNLDCTFAFETR